MPQPRILVAEDDEGIRTIIRTRLQMSGYQVITARNGREAVARVRSARPDALVLDLNMPEMDGFSVLETIMAWPGDAVPTLVLTARSAHEDVKRVIGLGAKDYLAKPFSEGQLLARVARLLRPKAAAPPLEPPRSGPSEVIV